MTRTALILCGCILFVSSGLAAPPARIVGSDVNMRLKPQSGAAVVGKLNDGDPVTVIEKSGGMEFIGMYLGRWCRIRAGSREGYVFSSFIREEGDAEEIFHVFFQAFVAAYDKGDLHHITSRTVFPLTVSTCMEGDCRDATKSAATLSLDDLYMKKPYLYERKFTYEKGVVHLFYGYEATRYNLYFRLQKGKWVLVKIRTSSC